VTAHPSSPHHAETRSSPVPREGVHLGPAEAAIFETFVVPRYLSLFGELALEMLAEGDDAQVVHMHCRTGYPDRGLAIRLPGAYIVGVDASSAALELARAKAATMPDMVSDYRLVEELPTPLPDGSFSHALTLHPPASAEDRGPLLTESARLLAPHGQVLLAMPMRGSFQEIFDLLREYALKYDDTGVAAAVEQAVLVWPTVETLSEELGNAGFDYVDVSLRPSTLRFQGGRDFFEDPVARLAILPELRSTLSLEESADKSLAYVREAIDKYWGGRSFELTVNVGCATGRRLP
jgi:SAM-dependent methyltransferase